MVRLTDEFTKCFYEQKLTDCEFEIVTTEADGCVSQTIGAHKLILGLNSPVFEAMFYGEMKENGPVKIPDVKFDVFKKFLSCFYNVEELHIHSPEEATDLYYVAQKYCYMKVIKIIEKYLYNSCNRNTSLLYYEYAKLYNNSKLEQICLNVFASDVEDVLQSEGFPEDRYTNLGSIFEIKSLTDEHNVVQLLKTQITEINDERNIRLKIKTALELTRTLLIYAKKVLDLTLPASSNKTDHVMFLSCQFKKLDRTDISALARVFYKANELCIKCTKRNEGWTNVGGLYQHDGIKCAFKEYPRTQQVLYDIIKSYGHTDLAKYNADDIGLIYRIYNSKLNYRSLV